MINALLDLLIGTTLLPVDLFTYKISIHNFNFNLKMGSSSTKTLNPEVESFVKESIENNRVVIFSKSFCPYCTMAKKQFQMINVSYNAIEIENRQDCDQIQDVLGSITGARSVPRVFVNGKFIGGGTDVKKLNETGELAKMLT